MPMDAVEKLERLAKLKEQGLLTDEEFETQKKSILASSSPTLPNQINSKAIAPRPTPKFREIENATEQNKTPLIISGAVILAIAIIVGIIFFSRVQSETEQKAAAEQLRKEQEETQQKIQTEKLRLEEQQRQADEIIKEQERKRQEYLASLPKPVVITQSADNRASELFDEKATVRAVVRNKGGSGYVVVKALITQGSGVFKKEEKRFMDTDEEVKFEFLFAEIERGKVWTHKVLVDREKEKGK